MSPDGVVLDPSPIPISTAPDLQAYPSIAFNGDNYVIAWQDLRSGSYPQIYGARLAPDGALLDPDGLLIAQGPADVGLPEAAAGPSGRVAISYPRVATEPPSGGHYRVFLRFFDEDAPPACDAFGATSANCRLAELEGSISSGGTRSGSNVAATGEPDEPDHVGVSIPLNSAWYRFTPTVSDVYSFSTCALTTFDTTLAAYTGSSMGTLVPVAANDDACGLQSRISFIAYAGTTYHLVVDGFGSLTGSFTLSYGNRSRPTRPRPMR